MGKMNRRQLKEMAAAFDPNDFGYEPEPIMDADEWERLYGDVEPDMVALALSVGNEAVLEEMGLAPTQEHTADLEGKVSEMEGAEHIRAQEALEVGGPDVGGPAPDTDACGPNAVDWYGGDRTAMTREDHNFMVLTKAFETRTPALFDYRAIDGTETKGRLVLVVAPPTDYVLAWDLRKGAPRRFKFDGVGYAVMVEGYPLPARAQPDSKVLVTPATTETQKRNFPGWVDKGIALNRVEHGWQVV